MNKSKAAAQLGRIGGNNLVKKMGKKHMKKISQMGLKARWGSSVKRSKLKKIKSK
jgi:hypothetical protein